MSRSLWSRATAYGVGAFLILLGAAAVIGQDNLFRHAMDPRRPFQTTSPPAAPDYQSHASWAKLPERAKHDEIAVFFVHPTTYWGGRLWNAGIDEPVSKERLDQSVLPNYARPFEAAGQVWAPRYRQAALYASLTHRYDARRARALAFSDVAQAFEAFLNDIPAGSPFILVGVEQGGLHVVGLLQHTMVSVRARERLAAAYIIDQATPLDLFDGSLSELRPCRSRDDVRCVVTWGAVNGASPREITRFLDRSMVWTMDGRLEPTEGRALACYNPVLGAAREDFAPARVHRGAADATGLEPGVKPAPMRAQTSTQCRDGVLLIDTPASRSLREPWSFGRRFKPRRANLLYADIEADARHRAEAFMEIWATEVRTAPPMDGVITLTDSPIQKVPE